MTNSKTPTRQQANHRADTLNDNKGTNGTNSANGHMHGNRSKQIEQSRREQGKGHGAAVKTDKK